MLYFIVNPNAGAGRGLRVWNQTQKYLQKRHEVYDAFFTTAQGDARKKAKELTEACREERCIITVGGDGTLNEVLDGMNLECPAVLGFIPAGSGNDFGKSLKLPRQGKKMISRILSNPCMECIDYGIMSCGEGECRNRRFLVSSGIGFDAAVCRDLLNSRVKDGLNRMSLGRLSYFLMGIREYIFTKPTRGYIVLDGERRIEFNHILFISAHIHPYEGGGYRFAPHADPKDGKLEICVVSSRSKLKLFPLLLRAKRKNLCACGGVRFFACREAHIHTDRPLAVHTDGEGGCSETDIDVRCVERQLRILK
ncbi:MAG: diacylglycerol kinase family lipid kinase [Eubacteriales bacterium]|nr:diacylglycerol kinase family lipid kinase [Eubacteriales bacterium]